MGDEGDDREMIVMDGERTGPVRQCEPLLALATPDLYARNPFRVLGARVDATSKDIQRAHERRSMMDQLGLHDSSRSPAIFPPCPDREAQRSALEALARPVDRLLAELFWFWPLGDDDSAIAALDRGDEREALRVWLEACRTEPTLAQHNLAVYYHARALDEERNRGSGDGVNHVQQALRRWSAVSKSSDLWEMVHQRAAAMDDPRVTPRLVREIRATLPTALLTIHARIAYAAAVSRDRACARRHVALVRASDFEEGLAEDAMREALAPVRARIRAAIEDAKQKWGRAPQHGDEAVEELLQRTKDSLEVADELLTPDDATRRGLHDEVAQAIVLGEYAFSLATNDWRRGTDLLRLAQQIALGEALRAKIEESLQENDRVRDLGNDWCAPGYWKLPAEVVAELEAARARAKAGDYEGAVAALLQMSPDIGRPLHRALASALSQHGIGLGNRAQAEHQDEPEVIKRLLNRLRSMSEAERIIAFARQPDPNTPPYMNPPCLCCGGLGYSRWVNFTYNDIPLFMCDSCRSQWDRQIEKQREAYRTALSTAIEYVMLADELDPDEPGVTRNLRIMKDNLREIGGRTPTTQALRARLRRPWMRGGRAPTREGVASEPCHFCGVAAGTPSAAIEVAMCGDVRPAAFVLGEGLGFTWEEVVVPRCGRCHEEHLSHAQRIREWGTARAAVEADDAFPALLAELREATKEDTEAREELSRAQKRLTEATAEMTRATKLPAVCGRCGNESDWDDGLCRGCDAGHYKLAAGHAWLSVGLAGTAVANLFFGPGAGALQGFAESFASRADTSMLDAIALVTLGGVGVVGAGIGLLLGALAVRRRVERDELRIVRREEMEAQARAAALEKSELVKARRSELEAAEAAAVAPRRRVEAARSDLRMAKELATTRYDVERPRPALTSGIQSESAFLSFAYIERRRAAGWGFGSAPIDSRGNLHSEPTDVRGLVS